ncbi:MAG: hypothetical protein LH613_13935 [Chamaesiphon sp.]|nr:hypothetical protein [Chamaesiphon sp.]
MEKHRGTKATRFEKRSIILDFYGDQQLPGEIYYSLNMVSPHGINPLIINQDPEGGGPNIQAIAVAANLRRALILGDRSPLKLYSNS